MNRNTLIDQCKSLIAEAYQEATEMVVAYIETHPGEQLASLCKEIDPDNWNALRTRVQRLQQNRRSGAESVRTRTLQNQQASARHARSAMRNAEISPDHKASIVAEADADTKRAIIERLAGDPDVQGRPDLIRTVERKLRSGSKPIPAPPTPHLTLPERWHRWLNALNGVLMDGARLAETSETEGANTDVYGELGYLIYQRITEKKIDVEIRDLLDSAEAEL